MRIKILGTESLGVRGLSCVVEASERRIFIDPGIALGYLRHNRLPHPFQVAVGIDIRRQIVNALEGCTDIVFSHYHGDHVPLASPNPYQLSIRAVLSSLSKARLWGLGAVGLSPLSAKRRADLNSVAGLAITDAAGREDGPIAFSQSLPHGEEESRLGEVLMTRIKDDTGVFVHASDIQMLNGEAVRQILAWEPDIVLVSGPPLYLKKMTQTKLEEARRLSLLLARQVSTLILDHHLLRSKEGFEFMQELSREAGKAILCAADFMAQRRLPCEADRASLYREIPVPEGWHKDYAAGKADTAPFRNRKSRGIRMES